MKRKNCEAEATSSASHKDTDVRGGALEIDCERRTGKLKTGEVRPGQLLAVNREPLGRESGVESRGSVEEEDGEESVQ